MKNIDKDLYYFAQKLQPFHRSLTGSGNRETLKSIKEILPNLKIKSTPSLSKAFDWEVPKEWIIKDAHILTPDKKKICSIKKNKLHVMAYSAPINKEISLAELDHHLYSLPDKPNSIPFVGTYYNKNWGFCIEHNKRKKLKQGNYKVVIDSRFKIGCLNYGEIIIKGSSKKEIFLSTYICHPTMANDNLSGIAVTTFLAKWLSQQKNLKFSYRIIFIPETIGSINYLSKNLKNMKKYVYGGFNITCVGDDRCYSFLPSRNGNTISDKIAKHVLSYTDKNYIKYSWSDRGSDERQYCSPGVDLPIASILRSKFGEYKEYHTSKDTFKNVVTKKGLLNSYLVYIKAIEVFEKNTFIKAKFKCEPQLGKKNLYSNVMTTTSFTNYNQKIMDILTWSDGKKTLLDIAEITNTPIWKYYSIIETLEKHNLISII